ncbi:MAG: hypothetical protein AB7T49_09145 [Oligoflexales bacterium]
MKRILKALSPALLAFGLASPSFSRPVDFVLDSPAYIAKEHTAYLKVVIYYADGSHTSQDVLSRDELRSGLMSKTIEVRDDSEIQKCFFAWPIMQGPPSPAEGPRITLIRPETFRHTAVEGECVFNEDGSVATISIPYKFDDITIAVSPDALDNHYAFSLSGRLIYEGVEETFVFAHNSNNEGELFRVRAMYPANSSGKLNLTWLKEGGDPEKEEIKITGRLIEVK